MSELKEGDLALVEGPYGLFSSKYAKEKEQVWIAGGIGITPFLSLAKDMYTNKVPLCKSLKVNFLNGIGIMDTQMISVSMLSLSAPV